MEKPTIKVELVTPVIAKNLLERNIINRRVSEPVVAKYAKDMANGNWKTGTCETIKIAADGRILDGQHRLIAVIKSNRSIYFHIAYNVCNEVFDVIDTGKVRNASDCFMISGVKHSNSIPSIIATYNMLTEGRKAGGQVNKKSTNADLLNQYYMDEVFWQNVAKKSHSWYLAFAKILTPSMIGGFYSHLYKLDSIKAEKFINQLTTGIDIENDVICLLRNKLMQDKVAPRKMPMNLKMALIIKSWNHFVSDNKIKLLKFDSVRDEFPIAIAPRKLF